MAQKGDRRPPLDAVGRVFHGLTVLEVERFLEHSRSRPGTGSYRALCACICGKTKWVRVADITRGKVKTCGCHTGLTNRGKDHPRYTGYGNIPGTYWSHIITDTARHKSKVTFVNSLTIQEADAIFVAQGGRCALTGVVIGFASLTRLPNTASLDRLDNGRGYERDNVQWIHKTVNIMRNVLSVEEFVDWCRLVVEHNDRHG